MNCSLTIEKYIKLNVYIAFFFNPTFSGIILKYRSARLENLKNIK